MKQLSKKWSKEEDEVLYRLYSCCDKEKLMKMLPSRTWNSISTRSIKALGLSRNIVGWNEKEDSVLREKYYKSNKKELTNLLPGRTWQAIETRAIKVLKLSRNIGGWTEEEIDILCKNYPSGGISKVMSFLPNRTRASVSSRASILGVAFVRGNCEISPLLDRTPEAFYWLGFLLADGHFYVKERRGCFALAEKDGSSVYKFAKFISCPDVKSGIRKAFGKKYPYKYVSFYSKSLEKLCNKYSICGNKTYNPPNISSVYGDKNLTIAMLVGLIDGDGGIYKQKNCKVSYSSITGHISWKNFYEEMSDYLNLNFNVENNKIQPNCYTKIIDKNTDKGLKKYICLFIRNYSFLKFLKKEAIKMKLPVMKRKWDNINLNYVSEREETPMVMLAVKKLLDFGFNKKEIVIKTGYTESRVRWAIKKQMKEKREII